MADEHEHDGEDAADDPTAAEPAGPSDAGPSAIEHTRVRAALDEIEGTLDEVAAAIARMA